MYRASFNEYEIEIVNDEDYVVGSPDNAVKYDFFYQHAEDTGFLPTSRYGIKVYKSGLYKTASILATGGATRILPDSAIVDQENLLVNCCNRVFSLQLPDLKLNWVIKVDMATCFSIHQYEDSYIIHGELCISRISRYAKLFGRLAHLIFL